MDYLATMMKTLSLPALILLLPFAAHAEIYKWVDENGDTVFSDQPRAKAQKIQAPPTQTFRPGIVPPPAETKAIPQDTNTVYSELAVTSPANDTTIRDNAGNVTISLTITPTLDTAAGHYMTLTLDGNIVADRIKSTSINLSNLDRGTHTVQVQIKNAGGGIVRTSGTSVFHLQRVSVR